MTVKLSTMYADVWSQVFEVSFDANPSSRSTIRSVNREWSEIAGNTPRLWSKLYLNYKSDFMDFEYVHLHLRHAGGFPLEITIILPDDLPYYANMPAISQLRQAVHRIKSLTITGKASSAWQKIVYSIGNGQPALLLERLVLKVKSGPIGIIDNHPFITLSRALTPSPKLIHLQLPAWPLPARPPPQLSTITSLAIDTSFRPLNIPALFPFIQAVPHLKHFTFNCLDRNGRADPDYPGKNPISLPELRSAGFSAPGYGFSLLSNFRAPLLVDVRLDGYREFALNRLRDADDWGSPLTEQVSSIMTYLSAQTPNIRRLELRYIYFKDPTYDWSCLLSGKTLPGLEGLILERTNIPNTALMRTAIQHSRLNKLELQDCRYVSVEGLQRFVQGRANPEFRLKVENCAAISREDIQTLSNIFCAGRV